MTTKTKKKKEKEQKKKKAEFVKDRVAGRKGQTAQRERGKERWNKRNRKRKRRKKNCAWKSVGTVDASPLSAEVIDRHGPEQREREKAITASK